MWIPQQRCTYGRVKINNGVCSCSLFNATVNIVDAKTLILGLPRKINEYSSYKESSGDSEDKSPSDKSSGDSEDKSPSDKSGGDSEDKSPSDKSGSDSEDKSSSYKGSSRGSPSDSKVKRGYKSDYSKEGQIAKLGGLVTLAADQIRDALDADLNINEIMGKTLSDLIEYQYKKHDY